MPLPECERCVKPTGNRGSPGRRPIGMQRRTFLTAALGLPLVGSAASFLAACGDAAAPGATPGPTTPPTVPHPTGAADAVLRIAAEGGFVPVGYAFRQVPTLLVSGDGRAFVPGAVPAIYPGPLLPALNVRSIDEVAVQTLLGLARTEGLLASPPDYSLPPGIGIADAPDTVVELHANGSVYRHAANALGMDGTSTPARDALQRFVERATSLEATVGAAHLGAESVLVADGYRFMAEQVDPGAYTTEPLPTVVDWPASTGVVLADSSTCATAPDSAVGDLFRSASELTFFREGEVVYQLWVVQVLPGDQGCD